MCLSVTSDQSCSVNGKYNRELLKSHVMDDLVICSLQKRRINRHNRAHAGFVATGRPKAHYPPNGAPRAYWTGNREAAIKVLHGQLFSACTARVGGSI